MIEGPPGEQRVAGRPFSVLTGFRGSSRNPSGGAVAPRTRWVERAYPPAFMAETFSPVDWREHGVKIIRAGQLDSNTPQTPGMQRAAAITQARTGASKLWAGTVTVHANAKTGAHHHGELESVIYVVSGRARMRWGERLEFSAEAGPGDFIYVPPFVPHQEMNARSDEPCEAVVVRSGQDPIVVNLVMESADEQNASGPEVPFHPQA